MQQGVEHVVVCMQAGRYGAAVAVDAAVQAQVVLVSEEGNTFNQDMSEHASVGNKSHGGLILLQREYGGP